MLREKVTNTTLKAETDVSKNANLFVIAQTEGIKYFHLFYIFIDFCFLYTKEEIYLIQQLNTNDSR